MKIPPHHELVTAITKAGWRPYSSNLDAPTLDVAHRELRPFGLGLVLKDAEAVVKATTTSLEAYAYYVEMKSVARPERVCQMPNVHSQTAQWIEWLACNDNYVYGPSLMDPRRLADLMALSINHIRATEWCMNMATSAKIDFDRHMHSLLSVADLSDGLKSVYGDGRGDILKELMTVEDMVAQDIRAPSLREHVPTTATYKLVAHGRQTFKLVARLAITHRCRPVAARAIMLDQGGESPMAKIVYGEDTPLTRFLISKEVFGTNYRIAPIDPVWWWENLEIRSKVNYKYAPSDISPKSWGWLLRAGVPPVVLCEHKMTKAEAGAYVLAAAPSWAYKLKRGEIPADEADRGMYFMNDKREALSGREILRFRYKEKISALKTGAEYRVQAAIDSILDRADPRVAEWALNKIQWLLKEQTIHGPRGQTYKFQPISRVDEIQPEDLGGSLDTAPEKVFERMGERIKKQIEAENLKGFAFPAWKHPLHPDVTYLSNSVALQTEGKLMHHCCGSYAKKCEQGETFIFHIGPPAPFGSTVEAVFFDPKRPFAGQTKAKSGLHIYQHYGPHNSTPDPEDKKIVLEWVKMCKPKKTNPPPRWQDVVLCQPMRG